MAEGDEADAAKAALSKSVTEDAERAVRLLQKLLATQGEGKKPAMAKTSLAAAKVRAQNSIAQYIPRGQHHYSTSALTVHI